MTRLPFTQEEITEIIAAARQAEKLRARVTRLQVALANTHGDVEAMRWPNNLIGRMERLLELRDYQSIRELLTEWEEWIEENKKINRLIEETATLIRGFIEDYEATDANG